MGLIKEMYSSSGINRIYQLLKNEAAGGCPKEYDIKVDAMKVVSRNNDPERFFEHEQFLVASSKSITVNIYDGTSPRCMKHTLLLEPEQPTSQELSGLEQSFNDRIQQERKGWEHDKLRSTNAELRQQLNEKERYVSQLEGIISAMRAEKEQMPGKLTNALLSLAGLFLSNQKDDVGKQLLAGLFNASQSENDDGCDVTATYRKAEDEESPNERGENDEGDLKYTGTATEKDFDRMERALIPLFAEEHRETVATVVSIMYHNNQLIPEVAELLNGEDAQQQAA